MNWHKELSTAATDKGIVVLVNEYLQNLKPGLRDRLSAEIPTEIRDANDLQALQQRVVQAFMGNPIYAVDIPMQDLCVFVIRASSRAHELAARKLPAVKRHESIFASNYDSDD